MAAATHNITIERGADLSFDLTIKDSDDVVVDLSAIPIANFKAQIRRGSGKPLIASFSTSFKTDGTDGIVVFTLTDTESNKLNSEHRYTYDVFWQDAAGTRDYLIRGTATVSGNITLP